MVVNVQMPLKGSLKVVKKDYKKISLFSLRLSKGIGTGIAELRRTIALEKKYEFIAL